jgi:outer membrane lipoprotein carrier protein
MQLNRVITIVSLALVSAHAFSKPLNNQNQNAAEISTTAQGALGNYATENAASEHSTAGEKLKAILGALNSYEARFNQQIIDAQGETLQSSEGQIYLQKPNKMRWEVSSPDESLFIADGSVIYNIDHFVEQVTLIEQCNITNNNPLMLLISDDADAWNNVTINEDEQGFTVRSKDENANIVLLNLRFENDILTSLSSIDRQEQSNVIVFSDISQNTNISSAQFVPNIPDTYVVDDQRSAGE